MPLFSTNLDVRMTQGNTPVLKMAIWDDQGNAYNTTQSGLGALWVLKKNVGDVALVTKTDETEITFSAPNWVNIPMDAGDTNAIYGRYIHELELNDSNGNVMTVKKIEDSIVGDTPAINIFQIDRAIASSS